MDDLISRTQAIDALDEQIKYCDNALCDFNISLKDEYAVKVERASLCAYKEILEDLPSAQPEPHWIPCSERLPEDGQDVLVTYKTTGKIHPCQYHDDGSRNPWYSYIDQCRAYMNVVLAWMPLPEPYAERRTDD